jgi:deoxyribodipyrimidine photo-lyase
VQFIYESIAELDLELKKSGSHLIVLYGNPTDEIPKLVNKLKINAVFVNEDYEPKAKSRDEMVKARLSKIGKPFLCYKDQVIFSGSEVLKENGDSYRKFTPYKNAWLKKLGKAEIASYQPTFKKLNCSVDTHNFSMPTLEEMGFTKSSIAWTAGSKSAHKILSSFSEKIGDYENDRNFPSIKGTSILSPHLRFGTISIRTCLREAMKNRTKGNSTWISELIWREFYQMILDRNPKVETEEFQSKTRGIVWPGKKEHFKAWCQGQTGFPIVDAAMRQLNTTGWMHNRLRMITASFLVKDLLIDWRLGENYFAEKLIDFDLASNNGGWQWCASTGCDAQPYFRIFNPWTQSRKFDESGEFIRKFVPELSALSNKEIHEPHLRKDRSKELKYPKPIVDHKIQRDLALRLFKANELKFTTL